jgi:hypothetical protein
MSPSKYNVDHHPLHLPPRSHTTTRSTNYEDCHETKSYPIEPTSNKQMSHNHRHQWQHSTTTRHYYEFRREHHTNPLANLHVDALLVIRKTLDTQRTKQVGNFLHLFTRDPSYVLKNPLDQWTSNGRKYDYGSLLPMNQDAYSTTLWTPDTPTPATSNDSQHTKTKNFSGIIPIQPTPTHHTPYSPTASLTTL